jgi:hypothetical protein
MMHGANNPEGEAKCTPTTTKPATDAGANKSTTWQTCTYVWVAVVVLSVVPHTRLVWARGDKQGSTSKQTVAAAMLTFYVPSLAPAHEVSMLALLTAERHL